MKRFRFSLQQVLKVKGIREKEKQKELADASSRYETEKYKLQEMLREEQQTFFTINSLHEHHVSPVVINTLYRNLSSRQIMRQLQNETVDAALKIVDQKRLLLLNATREKKILEKLREKQYSTYLDDAETEEQKFLDDIAVTHRIHQDMQE